MQISATNAPILRIIEKGFLIIKVLFSQFFLINVIQRVKGEESKHEVQTSQPKAALAALLALSLIITACTESTASDDSAAAEAVTPVKVAVVEQGALTMRNEIISITKPNKSVDVYPKMAGELAQLYVSRGDYIEAGAKLGAIDTENLRIQIQQGEAALAKPKPSSKMPSSA